MEVILSQLIQLKELNKGFKIVRKTFQSDIIPPEGAILHDSVWKADAEQKVASVEISYQEKYCYVNITPIVLNTNDPKYLNEYVDMTKLHGWE